MSEKKISLDLAKSLAWVENDALDAAESACRSLGDANRLNKLGLGLGSKVLTDLGTDKDVAEDSLNYARSVVPNFRTEVQLPRVESIANNGALTPEEIIFKETLLGNFETSYETYTSVLDVINDNTSRKTKENKLEIATEAESRTAVEALLTPGVVRHAMREMKEFSEKPEANSPGVGFDIVLVPNVDLTIEDEDAVAAKIQSLMTQSSITGDYGCSGYKHDLLHNQSTAHKSDSTTDSPVVAVLAPRHLNMRIGNVSDQKANLNQHNQRPEAETKLQTADDITAMAHILALIEQELVDTTTIDYKNKLWITNYKNVSAQPMYGQVPYCEIGSGGIMLVRGSWNIEYDSPSRALMVPKA